MIVSTKKINFDVSERKILLRFLDVFLVVCTLILVGSLFEFDYFSVSTKNFYWLVVLAIYINFFGTIFEMYHLQTASNHFQISRSIILTTATTSLFYLLTPFFTPTLPSNRLQIFLFFFTILIVLFVWRYLYIYFLASKRFEKRVLLICNSKDVDHITEVLTSSIPHFHIIGYLANEQNPIATKTLIVKKSELKDFIQKYYITEIVVKDINENINSTALYKRLLSFLEQNILIREFSEVYENSVFRLPINFEKNELYDFFPFNKRKQNKFYSYYSRALDLFIAGFGMLIFAYFIPFLYGINFFINKGPFLYTQKRIGRNGKPFKIYKLRTMVENAEKNGAVFAVANDSRITPFGRFLRKSRLDEVPQFINVLKGEMAIIGPRPERPVFVDEIIATVPLYQTRHVIKPGLTGWAQVNYPYGSDLKDNLMKLRYDLYYIKHRSLFLDIDIILKTISTVLFYRGQ